MFGILKTTNGQPGKSELRQAIKEGAFLVDVRSPSEFSSGSVRAAVNIPLDQLPYHLAEFKAKKKIIVFCRSGSRSKQAKMILEQNGFQNVLNGGSWENVNQALNE